MKGSRLGHNTHSPLLLETWFLPFFSGILIPCSATERQLAIHHVPFVIYVLHALVRVLAERRSILLDSLDGVWVVPKIQSFVMINGIGFPILIVDTKGSENWRLDEKG